MRVIRWGDGTRWNDPNARWGSPSYLLEPGDAGYVADPRSASFPASQTHKTKKHMPKKDAIKGNNQLFADQLLQFKGQIGNYATLLGVTPEQVTAQAADADRFEYEVKRQKLAADHAEACTLWRDITRNGGTFPSNGAPVPPEYPTPVPAPVAPGVETRFRLLCGQIRNHPNYNTAIGTALGIEGPMHARPDMSALKPVLKLEFTGGQVLVIWGWQGQSAFLDSCEILVDRGDGAGFVLLAIDTTPKYLDTAPMPASAKTWKYKAIYHEGDARVGQWSDVVSINVAP